MNPTFSEWIPTQDPNLWGLDAATIQAVTDYFHYREICDTVKMPVFFWRNVNMARQRYKDQIRLEAANASMDPLVSRYFESEYQAEKSGVTQSSTNGSEDSSTTHGSQLIYSGPETVTENWNEEGSGEIEDTKTFKNRQHTHQQEGTRTNKRTGDATKNFTKDASGSQDKVTTSGTDGGTETRQGSSSGSTSENRANTIRRAQKDAPQSAVNLPRETRQFSNATGSYSIKGLGDLDFSYASRYGEDSDFGGTYGASSETQNQTITRQGTTGGTETRSYGRNQQTGTDITDTETFQGYKATDTDNGEENVSRETSDSKSGDRTVTTTRANSQTNDNGSSTRTTQGTVQGSSTDRELNRNRYTGREGLTPQAGLESALLYLQTMPQAIKWLLDILEPCFIGVFDL